MRAEVERSNNELDVISAALQDPRAFAPLYEQHSPAVYRMCLRATADPDLADDLTSQIFIRVLERLPSYRALPGITFKAWLFTVARNLIHDHWRSHRPTASLDADETDPHDSAPGPEELALHRMEMAQLRDLLATLNERHRDIVELRLSGLSTQEIAGVLGITVSALKSAQLRAYANLRAAQKGIRTL